VLTTFTVVLAAVTTALFAWVARAVFTGHLDAFDRAVMLGVLPYRSEAATAVMKALAFMGSGAFAFPLAGALTLILLYSGRKRAGLFYGWVTVSGWALNTLTKWIFQRARPQIIPHLAQSGWYSFPSGHSMLAPLVFGVGALLIARCVRSTVARVLIVLTGVMLVVGISASRIYLGVHYPSDVAGALLAGTAWAALWVRIALVRARSAQPALPVDIPEGSGDSESRSPAQASRAGLDRRGSNKRISSARRRPGVPAPPGRVNPSE